MKPILFSGLCILLVVTCFAQDLTFSQFYEQPLLRNPALAGIFDGDIRINGVFRNQWQSVTIPYKTGTASMEMKFPVKENGQWATFGVQVTHDVAGDIKLKRTMIAPVASFHAPLQIGNITYISGGVMCGFVNSQFDPSQLKLDEQFIGGVFVPGSPTQTFTRTGYSYIDLSAGISATGEFGEDGRFYVGGALYHLYASKVNSSFTGLRETFMKRKYVLNMGLSTPVSEVNSLVMFADYFMQGADRQFLGGALYGMDLQQRLEDDKKITLYLGGMYRWNDAFIPVLKMDIFRLGIGLSYDVNVSRLKTASEWRGGFELSLSYVASLRSRSMYADKMRCTGVKF